MIKDPIAHFWDGVDVRGADECWEWKRARHRHGYGATWFEKKSAKAHRVAYALTHKDPLGDAFVCHHCDNPPCCNPAHLYAGNVHTNAADQVARNRTASGLRNGAYTKPESVRRGERHWMNVRPELRPRGVKNGRARLDEARVLEIASAIASGEPHRKIAKRFGVSKGTVWFIQRRKTWADVWEAA